MYYSWLQAWEDTNDFTKNYAMFLGSFSNPQLAQHLAKMENPQFESSDEDFEKTSRELLKPVAPKRRNHRKLING